MRKLTLIAAVAFAAMLFTSCGKHDYDEFVGTWSAEKVEYYNIDYAGNPIPASMETYTYDPEDVDNSIRLTFKADRTGEMRDSAEVHDFLRVRFGHHGETGLAAGVHVGMIAEDVQSVGGDCSCGDVEYARKKLTGDLVHIGDHQE